MAVNFNKTCSDCGHNWYPGPKDPATACPACGGPNLVSYIETGKGGGSSFVGQKDSKFATPMLILGVAATLIGGFFWYTENFAPEKNPLRKQFDRLIYNIRSEDIDDGGLDGGVRPVDRPSSSTGGASGGGKAAGSPAKPPKSKPKPPVVLPPVGGDTLHLSDGRKLTGKLVAESDDKVGFRYRDASGKVVMKMFERALVGRIERGPK